MRATARCNSCHAPIVWAKTTAGRNIPLDPEPTEDGNVVIDRHVGDHVEVIVFGNDTIPGMYPIRYVSHFVTCPHADEWRKP